MLNIVLIEPEIPQNTGNIARTAAVTASRLILVHPLGFSLDERHLRRAGLDYWDDLDLIEFPSKEAFFERADAVKRFRSETFRGQVATGATWSRGVFSGANLLKEARTIALSQASGSAPSDIHPSLTGAPRFSTKTIANFTVHYQPKFDMRTGRICGAEALVRGLDERGNLISPAHFIPQMEKSGALRAPRVVFVNLRRYSSACGFFSISSSST